MNISLIKEGKFKVLSFYRGSGVEQNLIEEDPAMRHKK